METDFILFTISKLSIISSKYRIGEDAIPHFVTFTVVGRINIFTREQCKEYLPKACSTVLKTSADITSQVNRFGGTLAP